MDKRYDELYNIIESMKDISDEDVNYLVSIYGEDLVNKVLQKRVIDNMTSSVDFSGNYLNSEEDMVISDSEISAFDSYIRDVYLDNQLDNEDKDILIDEIILIVNELNRLFTLVGCNDLRFDNGRFAWIVDKVEYSMENCDDDDLKKSINHLYNKFTSKRNYLMRGYLRFVISIAKTYYRRNCIPLEELIQYGNLGLMRAIENYNYDYDCEFITYAGSWINQSIMSNSKKIMYQVKKPSHMFGLNNLRIKAINELSQKYRRMPTNKEIADYMGKDIETVKIINAAFLEALSLDEEIESTYDGVFITRKDAIEDGMVDVEQSVMDVLLNEELMECLNDFLGERDHFIIKSRYFEEKTFFEISLVLGLTHQRVGQLHNKALQKLSRNRRIKELKKAYFE